MHEKARYHSHRLKEKQLLLQMEELFVCVKNFVCLGNNNEAKVICVFAVLDQEEMILKCNPEYGILEQICNMKLTTRACSKLKTEASVKSHIK